ncbi:MAG: N-acetyl sugar amidotransferase [Roseibium sp.]
MTADQTYQICRNCIMDTSDPWIIFDDQGVCNHCQNFKINIIPRWMPNHAGKAVLEKKANEIRLKGAGQEYDCIIGVSGGIDSSYLLHVAKEIMNLRPLAVHVDAGWNSEQAVRNIEKLTSKLDIDLFTYVVNWKEMRDLQLSYMKSSIANQDVPQDHVFFAKLYDFAIKNKIKYTLTGANFATESILPRSWGYNATDSKQLRAIHRMFGSVMLKSYVMSSIFKSYVYYPYILGIKVFSPLNFMPYDKDEAIDFLSSTYGWEYYGGKHFESRWTKFFQSYYLPKKFGYDKRRAHLSSLIVSGQRTREACLEEMQKPPYDELEVTSDLQFVAKKLRIGLDELEALINLPNKEYTDYPNNSAFEQFLRKIKLLMVRLKLL